MSDDLKRMERKHFKELRNNRKRRDKVGEELTEWKEKVCDLEEVNCYPDQLQEFSGEIHRDDCTFALLPNGAKLRTGGTVDRLSKELLKEAREFQKQLRELDEQLVKKIEGYCDIYDTFPDLIDIAKGTIGEHETAVANKTDDGPVALEED